jgi:predicted nucleic acid-binding protein
MKPVFADTFYWIALVNPRDNWHQTVLNYTYDHPNQTIITTDGIVEEVLNYASSRGFLMKQKALLLYKKMLQEPNIEVVSYNSQLRELGLELYEQRLDNGYSLTDCISMIVMRQMGIQEVLSNDKHFLRRF